jgi:hypothetical protein
MADLDRATSAAAERGYETRDIRPKWAVAAAAGLAFTLVLVGLAIWGLLAYLHSGVMARRPALTEIERADLPPPSAPQAQINDPSYLAARRQAADQQLGSYGWVDRAQGVVHIPINEAMKGLAEQGWPSPAPQQTEAQP